MADDENEFLKDEAENDPAEIQKEAIRVQKEGLAFYKKMLEKEKLKEAQRVEVGPGEYLAAEGIVGHPHASRPGPRPIALQIRPIDNGFILALAHEPYPGHSGPAKEHYYPTIPELLQGLEGIVQGAFPAPTPTPEARKGCTPGVPGQEGVPGIPDGT